MTPWLALLALCLAALGVPAAARWWRRRALTDPLRDPGAWWVSRASRAALEDLLNGGLEPRVMVEQALDLCRLDDGSFWRGGVRRILPAAARLPPGPDSSALWAEIHLALGEIAAARRALQDLPVDHWRANAVRSALYELSRDPERAQSALVAAAQLGPAERRTELYRRLERLRRRLGSRVGPPLTLWERPPGD